MQLYHSFSTLVTPSLETKMHYNACMAVLLLILGGCAPRNTDDVVIRSGDFTITRSEVDAVTETFRAQLTQMQPEAAFGGMDRELRKSSAMQLLANHLMADKARQRGLSVSESSVDKAFEQVRTSLGKARFEQELKNSGKSEEQFRGYIRDGMLVDTLTQVLLEQVDTISQDSCKAFYHKNTSYFTEPSKIALSHILLTIDSSASSNDSLQKYELARNIQTLLRRGADFSTLAKQHSQGPNAASGGDMGWFAPTDIMPQLRTAALALDSGEISEIIPSEHGLHIIRKEGAREPVALDFEKVKKDIRTRLEVYRRTNIIREYMEKLIAEAQVTWVDSTLAP
jgi:parvulin-like peptidyl-prolyl isomerase